MAVTTVDRRSIIITPVRTPSRRHVIRKRRLQRLDIHAQQRPALHEPELRLEDRVSVLFVLFQIRQRRRPRLQPLVKLPRRIAEPHERLHLLKLKNPAFLLEFLEFPRMVRAHIVRERDSVRRHLSNQAIRTDHRVSRRQVRALLVRKSVTAVGPGVRREIVGDRCDRFSGTQRGNRPRRTGDCGRLQKRATSEGVHGSLNNPLIPSAEASAVRGGKYAGRR